MFFRSRFTSIGLAAVLFAVLTVAGLTATAQEADPALWSAETPCENYRHPYEADLCQQWRQAQAAEEAAKAADRTAAATQRAARHALLQTLIAAAVAVLLSLIGLALLASAYVAWKAARAFEQARRQELRAYVDVDKLEFVEAPETEGIVKIKLVFKNSGQTPAFDQRSAAEVKVHEPEDGAEVPIMPLPDRAANSGTPRLGRDAVSASIVECTATRDIADRVSKGNAVILVWGWTEYVDIFDQARKTPFQYVCDADTVKSGLIFKPMQRSGEIT